MRLTSTNPAMIVVAALLIVLPAASPASAMSSDSPSGGGSGTPRPKPKNICPRGQAWSPSEKKCVAANSSQLKDEERVSYGRELAESGYYTHAIAVLETASAKDPVALTYLGYSHRKLGRVDQGIALYKQALAIDGDNVNTREYLGEGYVAQGRADLARQELAEIERRCGKACEAYTELAAAIAKKRWR